MTEVQPHRALMAEAALKILLAQTLLHRTVLVELENEETYEVREVVFGRDVGEAFDHVTTNVSPEFKYLQSHFFYTSEIVALVEQETGDVLFESRVPRSGDTPSGS